ncbi:hypothetical protein BN12_20029 [Nostocoides japonicum T1-X7]|uniref:Uncharacterized protein n=1 Tax=Nostocoides japonicum T1-X7 TaxID=1194083 RepID=A0A077LUZ4_9MICO|nr:hypothetical protein BN12_20029 [Tetrasphaera japonica T1-X7]
MQAGDGPGSWDSLAAPAFRREAVRWACSTKSRHGRVSGATDRFPAWGRALLVFCLARH